MLTVCCLRACCGRCAPETERLDLFNLLEETGDADGFEDLAKQALDKQRSQRALDAELSAARAELAQNQQQVARLQGQIRAAAKVRSVAEVQAEAKAAREAAEAKAAAAAEELEPRLPEEEKEIFF